MVHIGKNGYTEVEVALLSFLGLLVRKISGIKSSGDFLLFSRLMQ